MPLQRIYNGTIYVDSNATSHYTNEMYGLHYYTAFWVLLLRAKSDAPAEFETWVNPVENGREMRIEAVMFDNAKELLARK